MGSDRLQAIEFSLDSLFEMAVGRLLKHVANAYGLTAQVQRSDRDALVDDLGYTYRPIRPDYRLVREGQECAIVDAKFKPRYLEATPGQPIPPALRASNSDIYQLFYYQARSVSSGRASAPPAGAMIVPALPSDRALPDIERRTILHREVAGGPAYEIRILAFPLSRVLEALASGKSEREALADAPELLELLTRLTSSA
jgi:hypothetical protein